MGFQEQLILAAQEMDRKANCSLEPMPSGQVKLTLRCNGWRFWHEASTAEEAAKSVTLVWLKHIGCGPEMLKLKVLLNQDNENEKAQA